MPFFDNDKYLLKGKEKKDLLNILNSNESSNLILKKIKLLQSQKIGRKNPRNQKLKEVEPQKDVFISFYNYIFNLIKDNSYETINKEVSFSPLRGVVVLGQLLVGAVEFRAHSGRLR